LPFLILLSEPFSVEFIEFSIKLGDTSLKRKQKRSIWLLTLWRKSLN
jgi:hypothetical protein